VKLKNGDGMLAWASEARDMVPSLLPVSTSHIDLLNCNHHSNKQLQLHLLSYLVNYYKLN